MEESIKIIISDLNGYNKKIQEFYYNHFFSLKVYLPVLFISILGITLLISGFTNDYDIVQTTFKEEKKQVVLKNYGLIIGFGIGLVLVAILRLIDILRSKKQSRTLFNAQNIYNNKNESFQFEFSDNKLVFYSNLQDWSKQLEYFDYFKFTHDYLNLYTNRYNLNFPELIIPIKQLSAKEVDLLRNILNEKISESTSKVYS